MDSVEFGMHQLEDHRSTLGNFLHNSSHEIVSHRLGLHAEILCHPSECNELLPTARDETVASVQKGVEEITILQLEA